MKKETKARKKVKAKTRSQRTTHRSKSGKKLYAVRNKKGQIKDVQTFDRAHGQDIKRKSKAERDKGEGGREEDASQREESQITCDESREASVGESPKLEQTEAAEILGELDANPAKADDATTGAPGVDPNSAERQSTQSGGAGS